jgi:hypothetical protein
MSKLRSISRDVVHATQLRHSKFPVRYSIFNYCLFFWVDLKQLHFKDQRRVRLDLRAGATFAISQFGRNEELELIADMHELHAFRPTGNHLVEAEGDRLAAFHAAIENRSVNVHAVVVHFYLIGRFRRFCPIAFFQHFILEATRRDGYALAFFVFFQILFAFRFAFFSGSSLGLLAKCAENFIGCLLFERLGLILEYVEPIAFITMSIFRSGGNCRIRFLPTNMPNA